MSDLVGRTSFISTSAASSWDGGVVVGTGSLGAITHGGPQEHQISLAHERYFLPANLRTPAPHIAAEMPSIRQALAGGDTDTAAAIVQSVLEAADATELIWTDPLAPCSQIVWRPAEDADGTGYRRAVDFADGTATLTWLDSAGERLGLRLSAPRGTDTVILELIAGAAPLSGELILTTPQESRAGGENVGAVDYLGRAAVTVVVRPDGGELTATAVGAEPHTTISATTHLRVESGLAGTPSARGDEIVVPIAVAAASVARLAIEVVVAREDPPASTGVRVSTAQHRDLVEASGLSLDSGAAATDTTEMVWTLARGGDAQAMRAVVELAYAAGRYNVISSTAALPPTLQGVWQGTWTPAWSADYTLNGNVQNGGAAALISTGTPELALSLLRLVLPYLDDFRTNARRVYGLDGALLPARMTTHGLSNHFTADYPHEFWIGTGGWVLRFLGDVIRATGDRSILDDELWSFTVDVLTFYEQFTRLEGERPWPSFSPENTPEGSSTPITTATTMDLAIIRDAARSGLFLSGVRGDDSHRGAWARLIEPEPPYRVADDGTLAEWLAPEYAENLAHRHVSQLYGLWYDLDPAFHRADLREAAQRTIEAKIAWRAVDPTPPPGRMEMAFGLAQLGLAAANLGLADSALQCVEWLARDHWTAAMVSTHDAGRIFNLDASGGLPAVVAAMLLGSSENELFLLQALPEEWGDGEVTGLRARNGLVVARLAWSPAGFEVVLEPCPGSSWLRPEETVLNLPQAASCNHHAVRGVDARTFVVDVPDEGIAIRFVWE